MPDRDWGLTPELVAFIKREEGWVAKPYICPAGFPTIGYGHRIPSMDHPVISKETGEQILKIDLRGSRDAAIIQSPNLLGTEERRTSSIVDFIFNLGSSRYRGSTLRKRVNTGKWNEAVTEMKRWVYAAGRVNRALVRRRTAAAQWLV